MSNKKLFNLISIMEVNELLGRKDVYVFDANPDWKYDGKHIHGSIQVRDPISRDLLPCDLGSKLIFYSREPGCRASTQVAQDVLKMGYTNVWVMKAGIVGWIRKDLPVESTRSMRQRTSAFRTIL